MIDDCVLLAVLAAFAWTDIRKRELPPYLLAVGAAAGLFLCLTANESSVSEMLGGICIGGGLILCALISQGSVGMGDGLLFVVTGIYLGLWKNLILLFAATAACAVTGLILILTKKYTRKQSLPFAPFVLASDVAMLIFAI